MDIREFAEQLNADITAEINKNGIEDEQIWKDNYKSELASRIIDYMIDNGEVGAPDLCRFQKTKARLTTRSLRTIETITMYFLTLLG